MSFFVPTFFLCIATVAHAFRSVSLNYPLTGDTGFKIQGDIAGANTGQILNSAGDFNADGIADLMVGAFHAPNLDGEADTGVIYMLLGQPGVSPFQTMTLSDFTTANKFRILGGHEGDTLVTMAGLGDFNGDGTDDIAVGAVNADPSTGANAGIVYVIYGRAATADIDLETFTADSTNGFMIYGEGAGDHLGNRITAIGDFNGDGRKDLFVTCDNVDGTHAVAYVIFGTNTRSNTNLDLGSLVADTDGFRVTVQPGSTEIYTVGDVNNDGYDDVGIADYSATYTDRGSCGIVTVIFGHSTATAFPDLTLSAITSGTSAVRILGSAANAFIGYSAGPGGDFNHDGLKDLVVGDASGVYVIFGRQGVATYTDIDTATYFDTANTGQRFIAGGAVGAPWYSGSVGDFDADGITDVYVAAPEYSGMTGMFVIVRGHEGATLSDFPDITLSATSTTGLALRITGVAQGDRLGLGASIVAADYNHDGAPDILVGAAFEACNGLTDSGAAYVIYGDQPSLKTIRTSTHYKVSNGFAFAAIGADGKAEAWGEAPYGGDASAVQSSLNANVATVVASRFAFAAVHTDGSLDLWGVPVSISGLDQYGAMSYSVAGLVASEAAFAGFDAATGAVIAVGSKHHGGNVLDDAYCNGYSTQLSAGVRSITASSGAFAAIKMDNSLLCWGNKHTGANVASGTLSALFGAQLVVATRSAFAVLLSDGTVASWGDQYGGGDSSAVTGQLAAVHHLTASRSCFVAFKKNSGVVVWGYGPYGGDTSAVAAALSSHVTMVSHTFTAMAALKTDGTVVAWGQQASGGDASAVQSSLHGIVAIYANGKAFAALASTGGVVAWGRADYGGSIPSDKATALSSGVVSIHHTDRAFAALKSTSGAVVVWGAAGHGGSPGATVENLLTSGVHTICANDVAFSAIKTDGKVVAWGHTVSVPTAGVQFTSSSLAAGAQCE